MGWLSRIFKRKKEKGEGESNEVSTMGPHEDLPPEKEDQMLNSLAQKIIDYKMEVPAIFFFETYKPVSTIMSDFAMLSGFPLMLEVVGIQGFEWTAFFRKKSNVERLLKKIEEQH